MEDSIEVSENQIHNEWIGKTMKKLEEMVTAKPNILLPFNAVVWGWYGRKRFPKGKLPQDLYKIKESNRKLLKKIAFGRFGKNLIDDKDEQKAICSQVKYKV